MTFRQILRRLVTATALFSVIVSPVAFARTGDVFAMTNGTNGNEVVRFNRMDSGRLIFAGAFGTGGNGAGGAPTSNVFGAPIPVSADALGSQGSLVHDRGARRLIGVNAGSDSVFCMRIRSDGLRLRSVVHSGGSFPVSVAVHDNVVYVLNAGTLGSISGYTIRNNCQLTPLSGSSDTLSGLNDAFDIAFMNPNPVEVLTSAAQIGISPNGRKLVVSYKGGPPSFGGALIIYNLRVRNGHRLNLQSRTVNTFGPGGNGDAGPFGFSWAGNGDLLVNHVNDSTVAAYRINGNNTMRLISGPVSVNTAFDSVDPTGGIFNGWSDTYVTNGQTWLYVGVFGHIPATNGGNPDGPGQLELFTYDHATRVLRRVGNVATYDQTAGTGNHAIDLKVVANGRDNAYLYALEPRFGRIAGYEILANGNLRLIEYKVDGLTPGIDPFPGTNPGIVNFLQRCHLDPTPAAECSEGSIQGITGY